MKKITVLLTICALLGIMIIPALAVNTTEVNDTNLIFVTSVEEAIEAGLNEEVIAEIAYLEAQKENIPDLARWTGLAVKTMYCVNPQGNSIGVINFAVRVNYSVPNDDFYPSDAYVEPILAAGYSLTLNQISQSSTSSTYTITFKYRVNTDSISYVYADINRSSGNVDFYR